MLKLWLASIAVVTLASRAASNGSGPGARGRITITVTQRGFEPAEVAVVRGTPVTLVVTRRPTRPGPRSS